MSITCEKHSGYDAFLNLVGAGVTANREIADELGVTAGAVSKWTARAMRAGKVKKDGHQLTLVA